MDLLVLGWDAATKSHVEQFQLPFYDSLPYKERFEADEPFRSAGYISSANAWTTLTTGASFNQHSILGFIFDLVDTESQAYKIITMIASQSFLPWAVRRILIGRVLAEFACENGKYGKGNYQINSTDIPYKRVWEILPGESIVYGCPLTYPAANIDGVQVSGIPVPLPGEATNAITHPESIKQEIFESHIGYHFETESPNQDESVDPTEYINETLEKTKIFTDQFIDLYNNKVPDAEFGFLYLRGLDDTLHVTDDQSLIKQVYQKIDAESEKVVNQIDPDSILLISDHGMRKSRLLQKFADFVHDHDANAGIWAGSEKFELNEHSDFTPEILNYFGVDKEVPISEQGADIDDHDSEELHQHLKDLGYA